MLAHSTLRTMDVIFRTNCGLAREVADLKESQISQRALRTRRSGVRIPPATVCNKCLRVCDERHSAPPRGASDRPPLPRSGRGGRTRASGMTSPRGPRRAFLAARRTRIRSECEGGVGSEKVRRGRAQALDLHGRRVGRAELAALGFGMGSVGRGGSVGRLESRCQSSTCSRRTGLSAGLKIRVSVVRFRPWPPPPLF